MHWRADTGTAHALNFGMAAPAALKIADFPLSGDGVAGDLFPKDRDGNTVAHTQTLLSLFGARRVSPTTGFRLNNGIMWFDPVQGRANSLQPGARCLMNICPILGALRGGRVAMGAVGGRKIVSAVVQLTAFLADFDMDLDAAFATARIDVSGTDRSVADDTLSEPVLAALRMVAPTSVVRRSLLPYPFAIPSAVWTQGDTQAGATETMAPWADAVAASV